MPIKIKSAVRYSALLGALTMIIGLGAVSAASAATKVPIWSTNGTHIPFGTEVSFSSQAVHGLNLKWISGGVHFEIECNTLSASGTVEDYASGTAGSLKPGAAKFTGCRVVEVGTMGNSCTVPAEIPLKFGFGGLTNTPYAAGGLKLSELSLGFVISKCPGGAYENFEWKFSGSPTGNEGHGAWPGEILFPEGSPLSVNGGGTGAQIQFGMNIQENGSTPIKIVEEEIVEPHNPGHHYWYTGGGQRKGEGPRTLVPASSPLALKGTTNSLSLEFKSAGIKLKVFCNGGGSTTGSVENPSGGGDGVADASYNFTGCILFNLLKPEDKSCVVQGGTITTNTLSGSLSAPEAFAPLKFSSKTKEVTKFVLTGCFYEWLNGEYPVTGSLLVSPYLNLVTPGSWSIPKSQNESSGLLAVRGNVATAYGSLGAETSSGSAVTWTE